VLHCVCVSKGGAGRANKSAADGPTASSAVWCSGPALEAAPNLFPWVGELKTKLYPCGGS
jgi:hypothetical protein